MRWHSRYCLWIHTISLAVQHLAWTLDILIFLPSVYTACARLAGLAGFESWIGKKLREANQALHSTSTKKKGILLHFIDFIFLPTDQSPNTTITDRSRSRLRFYDINYVKRTELHVHNGTQSSLLFAIRRQQRRLHHCLEVELDILVVFPTLSRRASSRPNRDLQTVQHPGYKLLHPRPEECNDVINVA